MLTANEIGQFEEQGFLVFEALIHGDKLRRYQTLFDELVERSRGVEPDEHWAFELDQEGNIRPGPTLHKIQGVCVVEPRVLDLAREPGIVSRVSALIGSDLDVFGTKFFPVLPGVGTSTRWHQDNFYFGTDSHRVVTCGIYLQDTTRENGCLKLIPGSHKRGRFRHVRDEATYGSWVEVDESDAVHLEVPGGTVVLFSAELLHGANRNRTDRTRYSTAWHYVPAGLDLPEFRLGEYEDRHIVTRASEEALRAG